MKSCRMMTSDGCRSSLILADFRELTILRRYDTHGKAGLEGGGGMPGGMDSNDLFSQLFGGGGGGFFGGGGGGRPQGPRRGKDLVHRISVSLEDLYKGKVQKLALSKSVLCKGCDGLGGKKGAVKECSACHGQGVRVTLRQLGPMVQQIQQPCGDCDGTGEIVDPKNRCKQCNGKKTQQERKVLEVHIDKGMKSGQQIKFPGESDQSPGIEPGDVIFVVEEKEHPRFQRKGDDLFCEAEIDLLTALAGGEFAIEHLDDRTLKVQITAGEIIKPGKWRIPKLLLIFAYPSSQAFSRSSRARVCRRIDTITTATSTSSCPSSSPTACLPNKWPHSNRPCRLGNRWPRSRPSTRLRKYSSRSRRRGRGAAPRQWTRMRTMRCEADRACSVPSVSRHDPILLALIAHGILPQNKCTTCRGKCTKTWDSIPTCIQISYVVLGFDSGAYVYAKWKVSSVSWLTLRSPCTWVHE